MSKTTDETTELDNAYLEGKHDGIAEGERRAMVRVRAMLENRIKTYIPEYGERAAGRLSECEDILDELEDTP